MLILRASGKIRPIHVNGVDVIQVPVIDIVPNEDVISKVSLNGVNYVIIMSTTVVRYVSEKLRQLNNDVKIIGVGPQTCNEVEKLGVACIVPREFSSYGIINMMRDLPRGKVVVLRSLRGNNYIINELRKLNYDVIEYGLYDVRPNPVGVEITCKLINYVDYVIFMSPMTYEAVRNCVRDKLRGKSVIAIGRVTESYMRSDGINPLTPSEYTLNGVLRLLVGHLMMSNESPG
ncbi:uroporphyrinogen-III synthase [Vulcanisaeta sp. JCM 16159]|uniref:uroporphyrinogen-III synthase n=1 Tax=Vulcanisaeta sp. JCM 16159 TaxID=1295371 RepID=UPI001FB42095|nr:uroporphyrinogen-III synthase [Vulcanisaeta sp. JCM 16159]